jgi:hypothetical protein
VAPRLKVVLLATVSEVTFKLFVIVTSAVPLVVTAPKSLVAAFASETFWVALKVSVPEPLVHAAPLVMANPPESVILPLDVALKVPAVMLMRPVIEVVLLVA